MARLSLSGMRGWAVRLAGSAVLLGVLFWLIPRGAVAEALATLPLSTFVQVLIAFLVIHVVAGAKWWFLLGRTLPLGLALRAHFAGLAANLCLPGAMGGDALRAAIAYRSIQDGPRVTAVGAADRLVDLLALVALSACGLIAARHEGGTGLLALQVGLLLLVAVAVLFGLPKAVPVVWRALPRLPGRTLAERVALAFGDLTADPLRLAQAQAMALAIQATLVVTSWWLAEAAGADIALAHWMYAWPLAKVSAAVPISLNGLGLREGVLASLLSPFGAQAGVILAAGLVWQAVMFCAGALGGLVYLTTARAGRRAAAPLVKGLTK